MWKYKEYEIELLNELTSKGDDPTLLIDSSRYSKYKGVT